MGSSIIIGLLIGFFIAWLYIRDPVQKPKDRLDYYFRDINVNDPDHPDNEWVEKYINNIPEYPENAWIKDRLGGLAIFLFIMYLISYFRY